MVNKLGDNCRNEVLSMCNKFINVCLLMFLNIVLYLFNWFILF